MISLLSNKKVLVQHSNLFRIFMFTQYNKNSSSSNYWKHPLEELREQIKERIEGTKRGNDWGNK